MPKAFLYYFRLSWFCFKLLISLASFALEVIFFKLKQKHLLNWLLVILIILTWLVNYQLFQQKNQLQLETTQLTPKFDLNSVPLNFSMSAMDQAELATKLVSLQTLEQQQIINLGLYLNLSQISQALNMSELSQGYLKQAQQILPSISY